MISFPTNNFQFPTRNDINIQYFEVRDKTKPLGAFLPCALTSLKEGKHSSPLVITLLIPSQEECLWCRKEWWCRTTRRCPSCPTMQFCAHKLIHIQVWEYLRAHILELIQVWQHIQPTYKYKNKPSIVHFFGRGSHLKTIDQISLSSELLFKQDERPATKAMILVCWLVKRSQINSYFYLDLFENCLFVQYPSLMVLV